MGGCAFNLRNFRKYSPNFIVYWFLQLSAALIAEFSQNFETQPEIMNIKTKATFHPEITVYNEAPY